MDKQKGYKRWVIVGKGGGELESLCMGSGNMED